MVRRALSYVLQYVHYRLILNESHEAGFSLASPIGRTRGSLGHAPPSLLARTIALPGALCSQRPRRSAWQTEGAALFHDRIALQLPVTIAAKHAPRGLDLLVDRLEYGAAFRGGLYFGTTQDAAPGEFVSGRLPIQVVAEQSQYPPPEREVLLSRDGFHNVDDVLQGATGGTLDSLNHFPSLG